MSGKQFSVAVAGAPSSAATRSPERWRTSVARAWIPASVPASISDSRSLRAVLSAMAIAAAVSASAWPFTAA